MMEKCGRLPSWGITVMDTGESRQPRCRRWLSWLILAAAALCVCRSALGSGCAPSQESGNAARDYRRAFEEIAKLSDADAVLPSPNEPLPLNGKAEQIVTRLGPAMKCLHEATAKPACDWETELERKGAAATFPHLAGSRDLARRAVLRARGNGGHHAEPL